MNNLKTVLCLAAALVAGSAQAQWEGNWLAGVSGDYNWLSHEHDETAIFTHNGIAYFTDINTDNHDNNGWGWGVLGGYQAKCNNWLLGLELNLDWMSNHHNNNDFSGSIGGTNYYGSVGFKRDYLLALTGRWGYEVSPYFMPYLRAGIETGRDKLTFTEYDSAANTSISATNHRQSYRFVGGVGAEVPVPVLEGLALRGEWNYHADGKRVTTTILYPNSDTWSLSGKQSMNTAKLSLVYNFPA